MIKLPQGMSGRARGFTMIELVVVMAVLGLLLTLAMPRYMASLERGREQVLQNNLAQMREAIDRFYGDNARYPEQLEELVTKRYLRAVPLNPFTEGPDWAVIAPPSGGKGAVYDVRDPTLASADSGPGMSRQGDVSGATEASERAAGTAAAAAATAATAATAAAASAPGAGPAPALAAGRSGQRL